jgi:hypothetical protein
MSKISRRVERLIRIRGFRDQTAMARLLWNFVVSGDELRGFREQKLVVSRISYSWFQGSMLKDLLLNF